jgi:hypothetical protein
MFMENLASTSSDDKDKQREKREKARQQMGVSKLLATHLRKCRLVLARYATRIETNSGCFFFWT